MHGFAQDLRRAARMLRNSPGFEAAAVLTSGRGLDATIALRCDG